MKGKILGFLIAAMGIVLMGCPSLTDVQKSTNADLGSLTISVGTLSPAFSAATTTYTASVENAVVSLTLTGTKADSKASVSAPVILSNLAVGVAQTATITVTAESGAIKTYTVAVTRAAPLIPQAPGAPVLTSGDTTISISWTAVVNATSYEVWYGTTSASTGAAKFGDDIAGTTATITGLTNGTTYYVWIKAKNTTGTSDFGTIASAIPNKPAPTLAAITPNSGYGIVTVTDLAGSNFRAGATVKLSKTGQTDVIATSVVVVSETKIKCQFDLVIAATGAWDVSVTNSDNQSASLAGGLTAVATAATIASVTPTEGYGLVATNTITGTNFTSGMAVKLTRSGQTDIIATNISVVNTTTISCAFELTGKLAGIWDIVVMGTGGLTASKADAYTVFNAPEYFVLDSTGNVGSDVAMAVDSNGALHLCYRDITNQAIKYSTNASGSWVTITIDTNIPLSYDQTISIAVGTNNRVHIAYVKGEIWYATNDTVNAGWTLTRISSTGSPKLSSAISLNSSNKPSICWSEESCTIKCATNSTGTWQTTNVQGASVYHSEGLSMKIDAYGYIHLSYADIPFFTGGNTLPRYATNSSGSWVATTIESPIFAGAGRFAFGTALELDSNGKVHIIYPNSILNKMTYATNVSGSWVLTRFGAYGYGNNSAIGLFNGMVYVSYYDSVNYDLMYATNKSGTWVNKNFDYAGDIGVDSSLVINNGIVYIAYYNTTNADLKLLIWNNP